MSNSLLLDLVNVETESTETITPDALWHVYVLECQNGRLYTGISTDPARRFRQHVSGKGARFTRANPPLAILGSSVCLSRSDALQREYALKQLSASAKRQVVAQWAVISPTPMEAPAQDSQSQQ
ncbi:MAG: GIY-YIG nuclease family protein [Pseudomonadota bacterium]